MKIKIIILQSILLSSFAFNICAQPTTNLEQEKELEELIVQGKKNRLERLERDKQFCLLIPQLKEAQQSKDSKLKEPPKTLLNEWNKSLDFCKRNALYICTAFGFYFTFYFIKHKIVQATNYLSQPTLWSSWRNDLSFNSLVSIPKETLTQWIVEDIQDHYHDDHSIKLFYNDVQAEQAQLQEIMHLYEKLDFFYMVDSQALVDVKTRLKVLGLLKDLVLMWELEHALAAQQT